MFHCHMVLWCRSFVLYALIVRLTLRRFALWGLFSHQCRQPRADSGSSSQSSSEKTKMDHAYIVGREFTTEATREPTTPRKIASMATIPSRKRNLPRVLSSLRGQFDRLYVVLVGGYSENCTHALSDPVLTQKWITAICDGVDRSDGGKFFPWISGLVKDSYYFTVDDDIVYPPNYSSHLASSIEDWGRIPVVAHHGGRLPPHVKSYVRQRGVGGVHFGSGLRRDRYANLSGTGVTAFYTGTLPLPRSFDEFYVQRGEADLSLAVWCQKNRIPIILVNQKSNRYKSLPNKFNLWGMINWDRTRSQNSTRLAQDLNWKIHKMPVGECPHCNRTTGISVDVGCFRKCYK